MHLSRLAAAIGLLLAIGANAATAAPASDVVRATLPNGLRVVIVRNTLAPVVSTSVNYLVGSDEAPDGFPGMAHAQEHMMFRGSPGLSTDQLADIGSVMGGDFNADTRESLTQYLYTVPAEDLNVALHIEALRMQGVDDSKADWDQERGAIEQEVAQDLSDPSYVLYDKLRAAMFAGTPYAHDALGTKPSFDATTADALREFHDKWYAPNNAILIIVGDLDPDATLAEVKFLFSPITMKTLPARPVLSLKPVKPQSFTVDTDRASATMMLAMRMPGLNSPDFPALEVLADVLSSHRFDLYGLVPAGKALATDFDLDPLPKAGMSYAVASFPAGSDPKAVEADVRAILAKVAKNGVPPDLIAAAKIQEQRQTEFQKNSIAELASVWAEAVALYGLDSPGQDLTRIEKVTVADVNRVARKYLDLDHAIVATMIPHGSGRPVAGSGFGGQEDISLGEAKPTPLPDWAEASLQRLVVSPSTTHPAVSTLANGITLIVQHEDVSDTVSVYGHIRNRVETEEPVGKDGVSDVLERLFSFGTEHLDRLAFETALDAIGASEETGTNFSLRVLASDFDQGARLLADNELHPALPPAALAIIKEQIAATVAIRNQTPSFLATRALRQALYPATDPSLREAEPETIRAITMDDVRGYYKKVFRPDMATIVVVGNITPDAARAVIEKYFGGWNANGPKPDTDLPTAPANRSGTITVPDASRVQASVILAENLALTRTNPDYYAVALGDAVLGGGFYSTRLSIDLRKNTGLVYSVGTSLQMGRTRGAYLVQYACDPQNVAKASDIVKQEIAAMQTTPVSAEELLRAKQLLLRQIPLGEASINAIAGGIISRRESELPLDEPAIAAGRYIALDAAAVEAAFQKWMRPDDLVRVSQGPAS